jgi:hypothetical protein
MAEDPQAPQDQAAVAHRQPPCPFYPTSETDCGMWKICPQARLPSAHDQDLIPLCSLLPLLNKDLRFAGETDATYECPVAFEDHLVARSVACVITEEPWESLCLEARDTEQRDRRKSKLVADTKS